MITKLKAVLAVDSQDGIGECPVWDAAGARLLWVDHQAGTIHEARSKSNNLDGWQEARRWQLHKPVAAALPRANGGLVVAAGCELFLLDDAGTVSPFVRLNLDAARSGVNEAKCDPQGRLWVGTLARDFSSSAALYRVDPDGTVTMTLGGAMLSNGMEWSPDGHTFYYIDSLALTIDAFDFDAGRGAIYNRRTVVALKRGEGGANGMTVDREGCLWVALTGGGEVRRYSRDGTLLARVEIATPGATSCAFGGCDHALLFITSRRGRMPEVASGVLGIATDMMNNNGPEAGGLFVCRPGVAGLPAYPFAG